MALQDVMTKALATTTSASKNRSDRCRDCHRRRGHGRSNIAVRTKAMVMTPITDLTDHPIRERHQARPSGSLWGVRRSVLNIVILTIAVGAGLEAGSPAERESGEHSVLDCFSVLALTSSASRRVHDPVRLAADQHRH